MIRVLVADDEPLIRAGIRAVLESADDIRVVTQAANGRAAIDEALRRSADVALVDIKMPVLDGLSAIEEMHRQLPELPIVVLTSFGTEQNTLRALQNGVAGFVLKNCTPDELIRAVRAAHDGQAYLSPTVTRLVLEMITPAGAERRRAATERLAALTPRESEILHLLAEGMSNAGIGQRLHMSETTIKTYVSRIPVKAQLLKPRSGSPAGSRRWQQGW